MNNYDLNKYLEHLPQWGESWISDTGQSVRVHSRGSCRGGRCTIHNPSDHILSDFPQQWNERARIVERVCKHGEGHPDPDEPSYETLQAAHRSVDCCGCCLPPPPSEEELDKAKQWLENFDLES